MQFTGLPETAVIREVAPRDGFQNVKEFIPTEKKLEFIDALLSTGIRELEVTSFVSPKAIPQMSDATEVAKAVKRRHPETELTALVPNLRGAQNAIAAGVDVLSIVFSCSESHNMANIRRTVQQSLDGLDDIIALAKENGTKVCVSLTTAFMCPFEGRISPSRVVDIVEKVRAKSGVEMMTLAETIGTCPQREFTETLKAVKPSLEGMPTYLHIHNTYGFAMMNTKCALDEGFNKFDTATGGLGGCPFAPGAAGNAATEDIVYMLESMGVKTGIDVLKVVEAARVMREYGLKTMSSLAASSFGRPAPAVPVQK